MEAAQHTDDAQAKLWNGPAGDAWVEAQALLDSLFRPVEELLVSAARTRGARRVLDVGCGTGSTTLALARQVGSEGACIGADISEPMLALARVRAATETNPPRFVLGNAQHYAFEPGCFDLIVSRFGVMFFDDPVAAFRNLHGAAEPGAQLCVVAWRSAEENPFMTTAEPAAAPFLPDLPARPKDGPGQFGFADPERVRRILTQSGWNEVDIQPFDFSCRLTETALEHYVTRLGPVGLALASLAEPTRTQVIQAVRAAFAPFMRGTEAQFNAACWQIRARA